MARKKINDKSEIWIYDYIKDSDNMVLVQDKHEVSYFETYMINEK